MTGKTSRALAALATLLLALVLTPTSAHAVFERVGPVSAVNGYPLWYQDKTGITLELCTPTTAAELAGGYCLLLPADLPLGVPETFPTNWFDEHFYWDASTVVDMPLAPGATKAGRAVLVQALEGAFATGPVIPGEQIVFGRFRFDFRDLPLSGTYTIYTPFGIRVFPDQVGGVNTRLFYTEDIGLACTLGDFTCALQAGVGPFLIPSDTAGGPELPPFTDPAIPGKKYIADPARTGPVTGSVLPPYVTPLGTFNANRFRIEVTSALGVTTAIVDTEDFGVVGRLYQSPIPSRTTIDRASYSRSVANNITVDVYATGEPTVQPRLPGSPVVPAAYPDLQLFDAPCGGTLATDGVTILPPFTAPAGGVAIPMPRFGTSFYGHTTPVAIPAGVCVVDMNAKDVNGNVVPHYDPAPLGDQVFISEAFYDPANSSLNVFASSSDDLAPPELSVGAFGALTANQPLTAGSVSIPAVTAPPANIRVLSQEGGTNTAQVKIGRRAATGVSVSASLASPQAPGTVVVFTAQGEGSTGYEYKFWFYNGTAWQMVQNWSTTATWPLPISTPPGNYLVSAEVRTTTSVVRDAVSANLPFSIVRPPATGVTVTPSVPSPQLPGTAVVFTAVGEGSSNYEYRFWFHNGISWAIVQPYSTANTWTLPVSTLAGNYLVSAEVRTSTAVVRDASSAIVPYTLRFPPATGVTVSPDLTSPQLPGTPVTFTALGAGSSNYSYRFWYFNGISWSIVRDWSAVATWTLPGTTPAGSYLVSAEVRTSTTVTRDAVSASVPFDIKVPPAANVSVSASPTSPSSVGVAVTFTAVATGSSGYQYQFWLNEPGQPWKIVQPYSAVDSYTLPATKPAGSYVIGVEVRTSSLVARDAVSPNLTHLVQ